ncbi:hypothetical protein RHD99_17320 [Buttiauxella selenatireducens]|uniref:Uncharacterized protein n=1 Tax=Buttiauxella selenatireducens TaxID=3073902 RepID=A0ABY9S7U5_9ENTR|nr:hypothetical protein [Buttiauxella sp. R73]WMY73211.1 hypothetical protein RHD99_17320 [Buttiauxella sp. R73]
MSFNTQTMTPTLVAGILTKGALVLLLTAFNACLLAWQSSGYFKVANVRRVAR